MENVQSWAGATWQRIHGQSADGSHPPDTGQALAALDTAPGCAREHARAVLWEWQLDAIGDEAALIVSELATNALLSTLAERTTGPVRMWMLGCAGAGVLFLIWDATMPAPVLGVTAPDAEHGRGLVLVDSLCARWGCYWPDGHPGGKVVWAAQYFGNSLGGLFAALTAGADQRVRACCVNGAPARPSLLGHRSFDEQAAAMLGGHEAERITANFRRLCFDPRRVHIGCPLLVLPGGNDVLFGLDAQHPFLETAGADDAHVFPGCSRRGEKCFSRGTRRSGPGHRKPGKDAGGGGGRESNPPATRHAALWF